MLFSDLIDYLKNEKTFNIILNCSTDLHEIRDVELLDGTQTGYATDMSILVIQMSCLLICSLLNVSLFVEKTIFFLIPARIVQQYRQKSFLRFLMQQNSFFRHMNRLVYMKNWFEKATLPIAWMK